MLCRRAVLVALALVPVACTTSGSPLHKLTSSGVTASTSSTHHSSSTAGHSSSSRSSTSPPPPVNTAAGVFARMSEAERVGQLLMVDSPTSGITNATITAVQTYHVGSVILDGTNNSGAGATTSLTSQLENANPSNAKLFIATDQEGGLVQRLQGSGFSTIPSAVQQGGLAPATLRGDARTWGQQLRRVGVNVDLAPVLDTVPAGSGPNPPIGDLDRQYGNTPAAVASHGVAFAQGLADANVAATVKHFPGLGRVAGNTDVTSGVKDTVTTADDPYLDPFRQAVKAGVPFVMVSTAIYTRIDSTVPAIFSKRIVTDILRGRLGFGGVIITDDVGGAAQVENYAVGARAVDFVQAGGDIVLTVDATQAAAMTQALLSRAKHDAAFKAKVDAAAMRVLKAKQRFGLLG